MARFISLVLLGVFLGGLFSLSTAADGKEIFKSKCYDSDCHKGKGLSPAKLTSKQWQSMIGDGEHEIFADPGLSDAEKGPLLTFLKDNAHDSQRQAKGIGEWN